MASIARDQSSDCSNPVLDVFIRKNGVLTDMAVVEYQIFDFSPSGGGAQVFPVSGRATVDLNDCPTGERIGTGHYVALWTVPTLQNLGAHRITWYFRETVGGQEFTFTEEFEVLDVPVASPGNFYITIADVRAAGLDATVATDAEVDAAIKINQQFIERATRQWFYSRPLTLQLDGNSSDTLHLPVPIVSLDSLTINDNDTVLDAEFYRVYDSKDLPDDRWNPRIKLRRGNVDLFQDPFRTDRPLIFRKGRQNQTLVGNFGFVESDGSTPELIKRALLVLVIEKLTNPPFGSPTPGAPSGPTGSILRETTDGHTVQYTFVKFGDTRAGWSGYTMNREVHTILNIYKAPIGVAAASARWIV